MASKEEFEKTAALLASLDKGELQTKIKTFRGRVRLDFSDDYLDSAGIDQLRHVLFAAMINEGTHN